MSAIPLKPQLSTGPIAWGQAALNACVTAMRRLGYVRTWSLLQALLIICLAGRPSAVLIVLGATRCVSRGGIGSPHQWAVRGPDGVRSNHVGTLPLTCMVKECATSRVAPAQRHPGPDRRHQQRYITRTSPHRQCSTLPPPEVALHWQGKGGGTGTLCDAEVSLVVRDLAAVQKQNFLTEEPKKNLFPGPPEAQRNTRCNDRLLVRILPATFLTAACFASPLPTDTHMQAADGR